jgi:hypothetical protein
MCRKQVEVSTEASRAPLTLEHIMYLLLSLFLLARRSQQVLCLGLERGLKALPNELLVIIIKINLTTNYQLLLNCNKVHRVEHLYPVTLRTRFITINLSSSCSIQYRVFPVKAPAFKLTVQWVANPLCTYILYSVSYNCLLAY